MFSSLQPLTVASTDLSTPSSFSGYAYVGADVVLGDEGFRAWTLAHPGKVFPAHEDGCYIYARHSKGLFTDGGG